MKAKTQKKILKLLSVYSKRAEGKLKWIERNSEETDRTIRKISKFLKESERNRRKGNTLERDGP